MAGLWEIAELRLSIGKNGRVVLQQGLFDADEMRVELEKLLAEPKREAKPLRAEPW